MGKCVCLDEALTSSASLVFISTKFGRNLKKKGGGGGDKLLVGGIFIICYRRKHSLSSKVCNGVCNILFFMYSIVFLFFSW